MSDPSDENAEPEPKSARLEIRYILIAVAAVIVIGGLYVGIAGSPTKNKAAIDSPYGPPGAFNIKGTTPPPKPNGH